MGAGVMNLVHKIKLYAILGDDRLHHLLSDADLERVMIIRDKDEFTPADGVWLDRLYQATLERVMAEEHFEEEA